MNLKTPAMKKYGSMREQYSNQGKVNPFSRTSTVNTQPESIYSQMQMRKQQMNFDKKPGMNYTSQHRHHGYNNQRKYLNKRPYESNRVIIRPPKSANISHTRSTRHFNFKNLEADPELKASKNLLPKLGKGESTIQTIQTNNPSLRESKSSIFNPQSIKESVSSKLFNNTYNPTGIQIEELKGTDKIWKSRVEGLQKEIMELKKVIEILKSSTSNSLRIKDLVDQIDKLNKQILALKEENAKLKNLADDELVIVEKVETKEIYGKKKKTDGEQLPIQSIDSNAMKDAEINRLRNQFKELDKKYVDLLK